MHTVTKSDLRKPNKINKYLRKISKTLQLRSAAPKAEVLALSYLKVPKKYRISGPTQTSRISLCILVRYPSDLHAY